MKMLGKTHKAREGCCHYGPGCCAAYRTRRQSTKRARAAEKRAWKKEIAR